MAENDIAEQMQTLRAGYVARLENELEHLEQLADRLCTTNASEEVLAQLHRNLHKFAGTAGTFGFDTLGTHARALDVQMNDWLKQADALESRACSEFASAVCALRKTLSRKDELALETETLGKVCDEAETPADKILKVLVADDDEVYCELLAALLKDCFDVVTTYSGKETLDHIEHESPDIVLLDIDLPDIGGYEVCERIKETGTQEWLSIIFVSGHDTLQDRLAAYAAGGDDFIAKPIQPGEFVAKLKALAAYTLSKKQLTEQSLVTRTMVFETMAESAQYGHLIDFMRRAMGCESESDLANLFFKVAAEFGLTTSLCMRGAETRCYAPKGSCSPIEENLFEITRNNKRLYHFGTRTMVNDAHVSFLIKNMPTGNEKEYGRLKDVIAILSEAMESAFMSIRRKRALLDAINQVESITEHLAEIFASRDDGVVESLSRLKGLMRELESGFHFLDLDEEQERYLYGLLDKGAQDAGAVLELTDTLRQELAQLAGALRIETGIENAIAR